MKKYIAVIIIVLFTLVGGVMAQDPPEVGTQTIFNGLGFKPSLGTAYNFTDGQAMATASIRLVSFKDNLIGLSMVYATEDLGELLEGNSGDDLYGFLADFDVVGIIKKYAEDVTWIPDINPMVSFGFLADFDEDMGDLHTYKFAGKVALVEF